MMVDWLFSIIRVAGASFPVSSSLVQLHSEIEGKALAARVRRLEDPVSFIHDDVPSASKNIYEALKQQDEVVLNFQDDFYSRYSRPLAALEAHGYLQCGWSLTRTTPGHIYLTDPTYIMYMCALCEKDEHMNQLTQLVDECSVGHWLDGRALAEGIGIPVQTVAACFSIYESKGYGLRSKNLQEVKYLGKA